MSGEVPVRRAIVSVADKAGLVPFGEALAKMGVQIVSTGSTAALLAEAGVPVVAVADVTGFPEMLDGRVKTLHPKIHAGVLADKRNPEHLRQLAAARIEAFDLVVVSLYPFRETVASGAAFEDVIEQIDIGGPTLVRAAAKNFESVGVVVRPERYAAVIEEIRHADGLSRETRLDLAREAFAEIAAYDAAIAGWFAARDEAGGELPDSLSEAFTKVGDLRYGENPHQRGALYRAEVGGGLVSGARVLQGKEMSFNNWLDAEAAWTLAGDLAAPAVVIIKHHNPCGAAEGPDLVTAHAAALASDPVSAYGGVVATSGPIDAATAAAIAEVFTEVIVAPGYSAEALEVFGAKKNLRLVEARLPSGSGLEIRPVSGGALVQDRDVLGEADFADAKVVTSREPTEAEWADLRFAWKVAARVTSNAIVFASRRATVGVGAGQMSRVDAVELAARKAGERARGAVMASDAFFPFPDGPERAAEAGITAVVQPGGSVRDDEVIAACEAGGMAMVFTGRRHFRH